jgi:protease-4
MKMIFLQECKNKIGKANYELLEQIVEERKLQSEVKMEMPYQIKIN